MRSFRWHQGMTFTLLFVFAAGCGGDEETGPGELRLEVEAPIALSAVVVEITGPGITSVTRGAGGRLATARIVTGNPDPSGEGPVPSGVRAALFLDTPGTTLRLRVAVQDIGRRFEARVLEGADADGNSVAGGDSFELRIVR